MDALDIHVEELAVSECYVSEGGVVQHMHFYFLEQIAPFLQRLENKHTKCLINCVKEKKA